MSNLTTTGLKTQHLSKSMSARQDPRIFIILVLGLVFLLAGLTVDPNSNCSESGECAPWLVYVALVIGGLTLVGAISAFILNYKWGFKLDLVNKRLVWWETRVSPDRRSFLLDDVSLIKVHTGQDSGDEIFFYDKSGNLLPFPSREVGPSDCDRWAQEIADLCPHIKVEVKDI